MFCQKVYLRGQLLVSIDRQLDVHGGPSKTCGINFLLEAFPLSDRQPFVSKSNESVGNYFTNDINRNQLFQQYGLPRVNYGVTQFILLLNVDNVKLIQRT